MTVASSPSRSNRYAILLVSVFLVLTAILVAAYFLVLRKEYAVLYRDLRVEDASAVVEELKKQQVDYRLADGGAEILVPAPEIDAVRLSLAGSELPVRGLEGFELFNNSDMGLTDFTQKIKYQRALQGELARTIMMMQGVAEARVHIAIPERALFRAEQSKPKAAVTLIGNSSAAETPAQIEGVQQLIAAAIPDLDVVNVVVLNGRGEVVSPVKAAPASSVDATDAALRDQVSAVLQRLLPAQRFDIRVELTALGAGPATVAVERSALPPGASSFPPESSGARIVSIVSGSTISEPDRQRILSELQSTGVITESSKDSVRFETGLPDGGEVAQSSAKTNKSLSTASVQNAAAGHPQPRLTATGIDSEVALWAVGGLGAVALAAALGFAVFQKSKPQLSIEDHKRFAERLSLGLELEARRGQDEKA